ncbi:hypothetical protein RXP96_29855, partial [Pseudomonas aeruginosa]|nr:hypothetical protein [Pseudomonas aeruginosa]
KEAKQAAADAKRLASETKQAEAKQKQAEKQENDTLKRQADLDEKLYKMQVEAENKKSELLAKSQANDTLKANFAFEQRKKEIEREKAEFLKSEAITEQQKTEAQKQFQNLVEVAEIEHKQALQKIDEEYAKSSYAQLQG